MTANQQLYQVQQERIKQAEEERKRVRELLDKFKESGFFKKETLDQQEN